VDVARLGEPSYTAWRAMNLDEGSLFASLFIGLVGAACFVYGKRQSRIIHMAVGAILTIYPYFVPNVIAMVAIAVGLLVALWAMVRMGY
jgi:hypothetical protein